MQALIEKVGSLSPQERKALAVLLKQQGVNLFEIAPVFKRQDGEPLRLSYAQERQWFLWQLEPESAAYHIPSVLRPADGSGNWTYTPSTPIANGTVVNVVAQDAAGNSSPGASVTVDSQAPAAPVLNPSNGTTLSGTAEPGATVSLTDGNGNPIGQVTADGSGNWSFTPGTPLANGTVVNATASDPTGNTSAPASTTVDSVAPAAPVVNPSNGAEISGTAEPGATVTLTDGSGNPIGQVTADGSGNWSFTPSTSYRRKNARTCRAKRGRAGMAVFSGDYRTSMAGIPIEGWRPCRGSQ